MRFSSSNGSLTSSQLVRVHFLELLEGEHLVEITEAGYALYNGRAYGASRFRVIDPEYLLERAASLVTKDMAFKPVSEEVLEMCRAILNAHR
jgi:hypothetical protein